MWGFEPKWMDMFLSDGADLIQNIRITNPETGEPHLPPAGASIFFRVGEQVWPGALDGAVGTFKVESEITDLVRRGTPVQFCISVEEDDWVLTQGRVIRG